MLVIPVPVYVPPDGVPVVSVKGAAVLHTLPRGFNTTLGNGFTVNNCEALPLHPGAKVTV